ncbi:MAG: cytochrome C [Desulfuromonadales bacterium]|nr:cytochrome C [Desulfuromonadales bacterium]
MKIDKRLIILWIASLTLFGGVGVATLAAPDWMSGAPGWAIRFFLGYCGIVIVAQVFAVMGIIRRPEDSTVKNSRYRILPVLLLLVFVGLTPARAMQGSDCQGCHRDAAMVGAAFVVNPTTFDTTAHAEIGCPACHTSVGSNHPDDGLVPSKAGCQDCHTEVSREYAASSHYGSAACHDCHNPHQARGATAVSGHDMNRQCRLCHATDAVVERHLEWLPQTELHIAMLPCVSCHTAAQDNVITLYVVKRQKGANIATLEPASYVELQGLAKGKHVESLIDGNEDNYISLTELRLFNLNSKNPLRLQGMMTPETVTHDFRLLANRRDCSFCHASGPDARQSSFIALPQSDGSYRRMAVERGAVLDALYGTPDFYMVGSTRSKALNYIGAMIIAGGLVVPIGHGTLRFLTRKNRQDEKESDHE